MCEYIKEFDIIDNDIQDSIINFVKNDKQVFIPSKLYSKSKDIKFVDANKRKSEFKTINNKQLFNLFDKYIKKINELDKTNNYVLVKNDITYIKYKERDFFKAHEDYLSLTTNMVEEYTGIMCVNADCEGGETIFHFNKSFKHISKSSITEKNTVLFRKDIRHEGNLIKNGFKEIITFNLWATPKKNDKIVIVSFKDESKYYIIPYANVIAFDNLIKNYIHFNNLEDNKIIHYLAEVTYDEFSVIYQILMRCYTLESKFDYNEKIIDYFCIDYKNILVDISKTKITSKVHNPIISFDEDIIISETPSINNYLIEIVKKFKLPYIPFKVVLAEGIYGYGGEMTGTEPTIWKMEPVYSTFSEYNNILTAGHLHSKHSISTETYEPCYNEYCDVNLDEVTAPTEVKLMGGMHCDEEEDEDKLNICNQGDYCCPTAYGLEICKKDLTIYDITSELTSGTWEHNKDNMTYIADGPEDFGNLQWYGLDKDNKIFLGRKHYVNIRAHLKKMRFFDKLRDKLKSDVGSKLIYPQQKYGFEDHFCNEEVYGNLNLIILTGLVRVNINVLDKDLKKVNKDFYNFDKNGVQEIIDRLNENNYGDVSDWEIDDLNIKF